MITVAAAEAAIGLAIVVDVFRRPTIVDVDEVAALRIALRSRWATDLSAAVSRSGCCRWRVRCCCWAFGPQLKSRCRAARLGDRRRVVLRGGVAGAGTQNGGDGTRWARIKRCCQWLPGFDFGLLLDPLSLLWTLIITGVGFLIHFYSIGYMDGDRAFARFFAYLNFFVFAMLTLVLSDNFVGLLVGWGLVGLASYFLIGFWFDQARRPSRRRARRS